MGPVLPGGHGAISGNPQSCPFACSAQQAKNPQEGERGFITVATAESPVEPDFPLDLLVAPRSWLAITET